MHRPTITVILCLCLPFLGYCQMSLLDCIAYAQENNLSLLQSDLNIQNSEVLLEQSKQSQYPNLSADVNLGANFGRTIDPTSNQFVGTNFLSNSYTLNSGVIIYNAGRIRNTIAQNRLTLDGQKKDLNVLRTNIALEVATMYISAISTYHNIDNAKNQVESSEEQLKRVNVLIENGALAASERYTLEAQLAVEKQNLETMTNAYQTALVSLKSSMNYPQNQELKIEVNDLHLQLHSDPELLSSEQVFEEAAELFLASQDDKTKAAELSVDIARASYYPSISLGGNLTTNYSNQAKTVLDQSISFVETPIIFNGNEVNIGFPQADFTYEDTPYFTQLDQNLSYGFGLGIRVPIYNNYQVTAGVEQAKINLQSVDYTNQQEKLNLWNDVARVLIDAKNAKGQLSSAEKSWEAQQRAYNDAVKRFDLGLITNFELTTIKNNFNNAQINRTLAEFDYIFRTKILDIYRGQL